MRSQVTSWPWMCALAVMIAMPSALLQAQDWPLHDARWTISIKKDPDTNPKPHEPSDVRWFHYHRNHPTLPDALSNTIAPLIFNGYEELDPADSGVRVRYLVHSQPVSGWLNPPFRFELNIDNPNLSQLKDGIHDLSAEVQGANRNDFKPWRAFVHLSRDKAAGEPFGFSKQVPIINAMQDRSNSDAHFGPGVVYVHPNGRNHKGFPVNPSVSPWQLPPDQVSLYQELMAPHTELFHALQMWWDHPAHPGAPFVRGLTPKHGEDHRNLRVTDRHERFPMTDGPRGIGWMSPYVGGQIDSQGRFAFAEVGGRIGYVMPDGEIITVAGWRVQSGKDPIWWGKPVTQVRRNMENRGRWLSGRGEFLTPLDVAIDPRNENVWYVVGYEDHVVWKVEVPQNPRTQQATISVFAGDPGHRAGSRDGIGQDARFNGPASIVFDPVNDVMYVADQDNDAIRKVDRSGEVTTLFGKKGMRERLSAQGVEWTDQLASRNASQFEVTAQQAAQGVQPDIYLPQTVRVDSQGNIILLEVGYGAIRRIDPLNGATQTLGEVRQKHRPFDRGWAWLDVDRYGNSGPRDGIYWCKFVSTLPNERFNEVYAWLPPEGGDSIALFSKGTGLYPDGWGRQGKTNPPHYPWLVAVDPRGGVLLAGGGEHGLTRLRVREDDDPIEPQDYWLGRKVWGSGTGVDATNAANSFALKYGWSGHNYLGFTDAWDLQGASDDALLDAFNAPNAIRNDSTSRQQWLDFIRPNTQSRTASSTPTDNPNSPKIIEVGEINIDHRWRRVDLSGNIQSPVVIAKPLSTNGGHPAVVRVRNVDSSGFDVRVQEWDYLDGVHRFERMSYLVVASGSHTLANGARVEAGVISASNVSQFVRQGFSQPFIKAPVVIASVATYNDQSAVTNRLRNVTTDGFEFTLREEDAADQVHGQERLHYVAWERSTGRVNGVQFEVARTGDSVTHTRRRLNFRSTYPARPHFIADIQTTDGGDTANIRTLGGDRRGIDLWIDEEQSADTEVGHTTERVGFIVLSR